MNWLGYKGQISLIRLKYLSMELMEINWMDVELRLDFTGLAVISSLELDLENPTGPLLWIECCVPLGFLHRSWPSVWWCWEVISHHGGALVKGISALVKRTPESFLALFSSPWGHKGWAVCTWERVLTRTLPCCLLIMTPVTIQTLELWEMQFCSSQIELQEKLVTFKKLPVNVCPFH